MKDLPSLANSTNCPHQPERAELVLSQKPRASLRLPMWMHGTKDLDHSPVSSQAVSKGLDWK